MADNLFMTPIFITSFYRKNFTETTIRLIRERTASGSFELHVYDNGSDLETQKFLFDLLQEGKITSLVLDSRNTGCLYNKAVFHVMTEWASPYYCVSDNDVYPPKLEPDWLSRMISIMDAHPEVAMLTPQLPPQWLQGPQEILKDIVYCKAVGNTFKLVRRQVFPLEASISRLGVYGDDGLLSEQVWKKGYKVAFCRNIFCFHAGQCENWGYRQEEIEKDPRKTGYGKPFTYSMANEETFEPVKDLKI